MRFDWCATSPWAKPARCCIDAVATQTEFIDGLTNGGWTVERPFQRMRFGRAKSQADEPPFAVAGPEFG